MNKYYFDLHRKKDTEIECGICGEDIIQCDDLFKCCNTTCFSPICAECTGMLIGYSAESQSIPTCPDPECKHHFLRDMFRGRISPEQLAVYDNCCLDYMMRDNEDEAKLRITHGDMITRIRKERLTFLQNNFPASIAFVVQVTFGAKLRRIEKKNKDALAGVNKYSKKCMNITCNGLLDATGECMRCRTHYCTKCEQQLKGSKSEHTCKEADLESIKLMNSILRCPTCNIPSVRVSGCTSLTCSNCGTFFETNGKKGGHGGGYDKIELKNDDAATKLTTEYSSYLDGKDDIQLNIALIESMLPPAKTQEVFVRTIKAYIDEPEKYSKQQVAKSISKKYNAYMNNVVFNREYHKCMIELEKRLRIGELSLAVTKKIHNYVQVLNEYLR
jgi:hypothetical protein